MKVVEAQLRRKPLVCMVGMLLGAAVMGGAASASRQGVHAKIPAHTVVAIVPSVPDTLEQQSQVSGVGVQTIGNFSSPLLRQYPTQIGSGKLAGIYRADAYLATSWKVQSDSSIVVHLRKGVKSSAGNTLTAADVKY